MVEHTRAAERLFHETGDEGGAIEAGLLRLEREWGTGQLHALIAQAEQLVERARRIGDRARELQICARIIPALVLLGDTKLADRYRAAADALIAALGARVPPWMRVARCGELRFVGDIEAAERCYAEVFAVGRAEGDPLLEIASFRNRGELLLEARRYQDAMGMFESALAISIRPPVWRSRQPASAISRVRTS